MSSLLNTLIILPFEIVNPGFSNSPYDLNKLYDPFNEKNENVENVIKILSKISFSKTFKIDNQYHSHVQNMISSKNESISNEFLKVFEIPEEFFFKNNKKYNFQKVDILIDDSLKLLKPFSKTKFIINETAEIGYLVLNFGIEGTDDGIDVFSLISNLDIFRFYFPSDIEGKLKYSLNLKPKNSFEKENEISEKSTLYLYDIINTYISLIYQNIRFLYKRPILFYSSSSEKSLKHDFTDFLMYNSLRRSPQRDGITFENYNNYISIKNPDPLIKVLTLNEGAFVIDCTNPDNNYIINKYFTSFILVLNQREILLLMNRVISFLNPIHKNSKERSALISKLQLIKSKINLYQLKQLVFSVSLNNEIGVFFEDLQKKFNIEILLRDNKDSVIEIHDLLTIEHINIEKEREDKRNRDNNIIIGILTCIQTSSAFATIFGNERFDIMIIFTILLVISSFMIYYLWVRKKKNSLS